MSRLPIVFMFSGQGSQFFHMGTELYQQNSCFRNWMNELDTLVQQQLGESVVSYIYNESKRKSDPFDDILMTHPAIFMLEYSLARVLSEEGIEPDYVMGASLGEMTAAAVTEALSLEDAIGSVITQAQIFHDDCPGGGMLAVLASPELYESVSLLRQNSEIAALNYDSHFVVSGSNAELEDIERYLQEKNIVCQRLPVRYPFHSSYIDITQPAFERETNTLAFREPSAPFISCQQSQAVTSLNADHFWQVNRNAIRTAETVKHLELSGDFAYLDLGPTGTMSNFIKYNLADNAVSQTHSLLTPFGRDVEGLEKIVKLYDTGEKTRTQIESVADQEVLVYVFPGQGSQHRGMGEDLFDEFFDYTEKADAILGYSIKELCHKDPDRQLSKTEFTQPALYTVNVLNYLKKKKQNPVSPNYLAGHSLGEYSALHVAGAFDFETGLRLVKKRGELMSKASGGGMAAVLGCDIAVVESVINENGLDGLEIANYNSPTQTVLSGELDDINSAQTYFSELADVTFIPLNVSAAFHSRFMQPVVKEFTNYLEEFEYSNLRIPVISNVHARPYSNDEIIQNLADQLCSSVRWTDTVEHLMKQGNCTFEEVGPGDVLTKLVGAVTQSLTH